MVGFGLVCCPVCSRSQTLYNTHDGGPTSVNLARASQCLSAGTCRPERIIDAVDFATPQAAMISVSFTLTNPGRMALAKRAGSATASGCSAFQRSNSARVAAMALPRRARVSSECPGCNPQHVGHRLWRSRSSGPPHMAQVENDRVG